MVFLNRSLQNLVAFKMAKQPKPLTAKVRQICSEYPDEFLATPVGDLRYNLCDLLVKCDKKFSWKVTEKVSSTKVNWRQTTNPKVSKPFYDSIK